MSDPGIEHANGQDEREGDAMYAAPIGPTRPDEPPLFIENPYDEEVEEQN
jgi:hypothetical protein